MVVTFYHRIISLKPNFSGRVAPNEVDCAVHAPQLRKTRALQLSHAAGGRTSQGCEREHTNCCTMDFIQIPNAGGASSLHQCANLCVWQLLTWCLWLVALWTSCLC